MNQILTTKPVKQRKSVELKKVIAFFAISMIIFGICLVTSGSYAIYVNLSSSNAKKSIAEEEENKTKYSGIQIYLSVEETDIKAEIIGENEISFVTYRWDDNDEQRAEIAKYSDEILIEIPEGTHTLTVTAVDVNNNSKTVEQQVKGIIKPIIKVNIQSEQNYALVTVSDEIALKNVVITLNGVEGKINFDEDNAETKKSIKCPLKEGENTLKVIVYNTKGASAEYSDTINN